MNSALRRTVVAAATAALTLGMGTSTALGAEDPFWYEIDAGLACSDFALRVEGSGGNWHSREFADREGNVVRVLGTGTGPSLTFINLSTGATFSLASNGVTKRDSFGEDGTTTTRMTGHSVLIMFPSDVPPGPSTTLYVGQIVFTIDADGIWTLQSARGTSNDICAALAD
jgi:hypothetical protein